MNIIFEGLKDNLDVSFYNKKHFSKNQISNQNIISRFGNFGGMLTLGLNRFFGTNENGDTFIQMESNSFSKTEFDIFLNNISNDSRKA